MSHPNRGAIVFATCAAFLAVLVTTAVTVAAVSPLFNTVNYLKFDAPVALPGVTLAAGEYAFQVNTVDSGNVVQVRDRRSHRRLFLGFTRLVDRPANLPKDRLVALGEALPGQPRPIQVWFPIEGRHGYQFLYRESAR